jgi:hypothetical protein
MRNRLQIALILSATVVVARSPHTADQRPSGALPRCLHDDSQAGDRHRREQALALAKAINHAEGVTAERIRLYRPLSQLPGLPPAPAGFQVRLYTDGAGYILSIKDTLDPCRYGIFSDESGVIYQQTPQSAPLIAVSP